jgi:hypothetical protein
VVCLLAAAINILAFHAPCPALILQQPLNFTLGLLKLDKDFPTTVSPRKHTVMTSTLTPHAAQRLTGNAVGILQTVGPHK